MYMHLKIHMSLSLPLFFPVSLSMYMCMYLSSINLTILKVFWNFYHTSETQLDLEKTHGVLSIKWKTKRLIAPKFCHLKERIDTNQLPIFQFGQNIQFGEREWGRVTNPQWNFALNSYVNPAAMAAYLLHNPILIHLWALTLCFNSSKAEAQHILAVREEFQTSAIYIQRNCRTL